MQGVLWLVLKAPKLWQAFPSNVMTMLTFTVAGQRIFFPAPLPLQDTDNQYHACPNSIEIL
jgi:hypothetical protein